MERHRRGPRDNRWIAAHGGYRSAPLTNLNGPAGFWIWPFIFACARRARHRPRCGTLRTRTPSIVLATPADRSCRCGWFGLRSSREFGRLPAGALLRSISEAANQESVRVFARSFCRIGVAGNDRTRTSRAYFVERRRTCSDGVYTFFVFGRARGVAHGRAKTRAVVRSRPVYFGGALPIALVGEWRDLKEIASNFSGSLRTRRSSHRCECRDRKISAGIGDSSAHSHESPMSEFRDIATITRPLSS